MLQTAIVAQRVTDGDPDTKEIRQLTEAAGARVAGELTQTREPDPGTELGAGKVEELAERVEMTGADTVVIDADLSPQQTVTLEDRLGARVVDRHRVVLEIFARQARTPRAQQQVELARLRYRLPRVRERADEGALNRFTESGTAYYDLLDRIDELQRKLADTPAVDEQFRDQRREQGFDLVAIAGYTNAGKSTLLRRLADEMTLDTTTHEDIESSAAVEDRLFKTLETTTRRATLDGRDVLLTDTVGFLDDLPHWLVESFRGTLTEVEAADAVLLVADLAQSTDELRRKLIAVRETLGADHPPVLTVLNKADLVDEATIETRLEAVSDLAPDPVVVSARTDERFDALATRLSEHLPALVSETLTLPLSDEAMSLISRIHDEAVDVAVTYEPDAAVVQFSAKPAQVEQFRARARAL
ncbi:GTPase HflX [Halovenus halobia]|uniref:GTPase HflX n=1 Tax=Halovenus halobia TaxID=3396622 RepID=UPI003F57091C